MTAPDPSPEALAPLTPPTRLLMGPGPINADPRVSQVLASPLIGQFDPAMTAFMTQTMELYRTVFRTANDATLVVDGTSRAGIEAAIVSLVAPGDRVLVPVFGRFGGLLAEIASRAGAEVHTIDEEWGRAFDQQRVIDEIDRVHPRLVAIVHGDTATTIAQPLDQIGPACRERGVLLYTDTTASLGGNPFEMDDWCVDAASAGLQKCLAGPSGASPVSLSDRAVAVVRTRSRVEAGIRAPGDRVDGDVIRSNYLDLGQIIDYWGPRRLNHHTEATAMLYAARECARLLALEGMDHAVARHARHGAAMAVGLQGLGLELFGDQTHRMHNVIGAVIPDDVDGEAVRGMLLSRFGIEIGTSFGPLAGRIWRVGVMGYNAREDTVLTTLAALGAVLARLGTRHRDPAAGVSAAQDWYDAHALAD